MKILITGANGQLGYELQQVFANHQLILTDIDSLDITNRETVKLSVSNNRPQVIIHAAAYTAVDGLQNNRDIAFVVNRDGSRNIAQAAKLAGARLVAISTDYVFDGTKTRPYKETDKPRPPNVYGQSKLAGEEAIIKAYPQAIIVRTAWLYGGTGGHKNFVRTILRKAKVGEPLKVVDDQVGSPTYARHLAQAIKQIIDQNLPAGIYHAVNSGQASWFEFAKEIVKLAKIKTDLPAQAGLQPIKTSQLNLPAKRPVYSVLSTKKLASYGITLPSWQKALKEFLSNG